MYLIWIQHQRGLTDAREICEKHDKKSWFFIKHQRTKSIRKSQQKFPFLCEREKDLRKNEREANEQQYLFIKRSVGWVLSMRIEKVATSEIGELNFCIRHKFLGCFQQTFQTTQQTSSATRFEDHFEGIDEEAGFRQNIAVKIVILCVAEDLAIHQSKNLIPTLSGNRTKPLRSAQSFSELDFQFLFNPLETHHTVNCRNNEVVRCVEEFNCRPTREGEKKNKCQFQTRTQRERREDWRRLGIFCCFCVFSRVRTFNWM